ncbi:uncharacterized protein LOC141856064 [Brevipalpus obovatus]|uniref:uncharacterized protein LOC141853047 n=1 Tax=Brevipalpus obovatus TaxID=246614 RepID=UPI003D9E005E
MLSCGSYGCKWIDSYKTECRKKGLERELKLHQDPLEYLEEFSSYGIEVTSPYFLRAKISSRHKKGKIYQVFVLIDLERDGLDRAVDWYCKCVSGRRTMTPCEHALCVLSIVGSGFESPAPAFSHDTTLRQRNAEQGEGSDVNDH